MATYGVAEAKNKFTHLLERAEAGESITITRHGKPVAEIRASSPARPRPSLEERQAALDELRAVVDAQPALDISAVDLIRQMRDEGY
ncbi:type II toxin-antitoxin system prevent-host-death family antitoxin [soil metagenome]